MSAHGGHVLGEARGSMPGFGLLVELFDAVGVGVGSAGFLHGGFPAAPSVFGGSLVCAEPAFGGLSAQRDLLRDLGELVFEGPIGGVGPFRARCGLPPRRMKRSRSEGV
ncbi:hypothetical protein [Streptomyces sp. NPDC096323]|uniref:hypothetical protein n=1 Tax=Streptomyces sp. NPDC096323 TaxID=3155822 RepID=UPI003327BACB